MNELIESIKKVYDELIAKLDAMDARIKKLEDSGVITDPLAFPKLNDTFMGVWTTTQQKFRIRAFHSKYWLCQFVGTNKDLGLTEADDAFVLRGLNMIDRSDFIKAPVLPEELEAIKKDCGLLESEYGGLMPPKEFAVPTGYKRYVNEKGELQFYVKSSWNPPVIVVPPTGPRNTVTFFPKMNGQPYPDKPAGNGYLQTYLVSHSILATPTDKTPKGALPLCEYKIYAEDGTLVVDQFDNISGFHPSFWGEQPILNDPKFQWIRTWRDTFKPFSPFNSYIDRGNNHMTGFEKFLPEGRYRWVFKNTGNTDQVLRAGLIRLQNGEAIKETIRAGETKEIWLNIFKNPNDNYDAFKINTNVYETTTPVEDVTPPSGTILVEKNYTPSMSLNTINLDQFPDMEPVSAKHVFQLDQRPSEFSTDKMQKKYGVNHFQPHAIENMDFRNHKVKQFTCTYQAGPYSSAKAWFMCNFKDFHRDLWEGKVVNPDSWPSLAYLWANLENFTVHPWDFTDQEKQIEITSEWHDKRRVTIGKLIDDNLLYFENEMRNLNRTLAVAKYQKERTKQHGTKILSENQFIHPLTHFIFTGELNTYTEDEKKHFWRKKESPILTRKGTFPETDFTMYDVVDAMLDYSYYWANTVEPEFWSKVQEAFDKNDNNMMLDASDGFPVSLLEKVKAYAWHGYKKDHNLTKPVIRLNRPYYEFGINEEWRGGPRQGGTPAQKGAANNQPIHDWAMYNGFLSQRLWADGQVWWDFPVVMDIKNPPLIWQTPVPANNTYHQFEALASASQNIKPFEEIVDNGELVLDIPLSLNGAPFETPMPWDNVAKNLPYVMARVWGNKAVYYVANEALKRGATQTVTIKTIAGEKVVSLSDRFAKLLVIN